MTLYYNVVLLNLFELYDTGELKHNNCRMTHFQSSLKMKQFANDGIYKQTLQISR